MGRFCAGRKERCKLSRAAEMEKNSQRLITSTLTMFVEIDLLGNSSKMRAGGSEVLVVTVSVIR